jgi:hypothetical protein
MTKMRKRMKNTKVRKSKSLPHHKWQTQKRANLQRNNSLPGRHTWKLSDKKLSWRSSKRKGNGSGRSRRKSAIERGLMPYSHKKCRLR